jgi:hypothetical protein
MKFFHLENSVICGEVGHVHDLARVALTLRLNQTNPMRYQVSFHLIPREFLRELTRKINF